MWALPNGKGDYVVTGAPVIVADLTTSIMDAIADAAARGARW